MTSLSQPTRATLKALAGTALASVALKQMFTDWGWLPEAWVAMALTVLPAAALRQRGRAGWYLLPGLVLTALFLTAVFLPDHAIVGIIPGRGTGADLSHLGSDLHDSVSNGAAPLHTTAAIRFFVCAGLALLAAIVDVLAVQLRLAAAAGVGFLLLFVLAGAVARHPVEWVLAATTAAGFLLVLSANSGAELTAWGGSGGRRAAGNSGAARLSDSGRRIGLITVVVALAVSAVVPLPSGNVIADSLHHGNGSGGGGVVLDQLATLRGQLTRSKPQNLFTVSISASSGHEPFYLREAVLDTYTGQAWVPSPTDPGQPIEARTRFASNPPVVAGSTDTDTFTAKVTIQQQRGAPPVFSFPTAVTGLGADARWSTQSQQVSGVEVSTGQQYSETVSQPHPTDAQLAGTQRLIGQQYEQLPSLPQQVTDLVASLTKGIRDPYAKAQAISTYFTNPDNEFTYSLSTKTGDSSSDLVNFLNNKTGYCQQYAAAMAVMLRVAQVPARVVVGYTHPSPDASGSFQVTTNDAHAWVEAYFEGIGWIPFDPTPLALSGDATRSVALPWAPRPGDTQTSTASANPTTATSSVSSSAPKEQSSSATPVAGPGTVTHHASWAGPIAGVVALLILLLLLTPGAIRMLRRRRRLNSARSGGAGQLWDELVDTCIDLRLPWSQARSPRQTVQWLREYGVSPATAEGLAHLVQAVELELYGPPQGRDVDEAIGDVLVGYLRQTRADLLAHKTVMRRIGLALLPASLLWGVSSRRSGGAGDLPYARAAHRDGS